MLARLLQFLREPTTAQLAKGGTVVLFFKVIGALGGYVLLYSLAQTGGEKAVGVYEVAFTVVLIGSTIGRWGLDTVLVKEFGRESSKGAASRALYGAIFFRVFLFSAAVSAGAFILAAVFTDVFFEGTPSAVLATASLAIVPFTLMLLNAEAYRGLQKPILFSLNQHGTVYILIAVLLLVIPMERAPFSPQDGAQFALMLLLGLSTVFMLISTVHIVSKLAQGPPLAAHLKGTLLRTATPMLISSALFLVMSWSDTLMLSYYLPEEAVGIYRIAFKIATLITFAQFALNTVVAPMISALHSGGGHMAHLAGRIAALNLYTAGPIFLAIVILGPFLIGLFGVAEVGEAYTYLIILSLGQLANAFAGPVLNVLNMTGYEKSARNTMLVTAAANIALNALLIPIFGPLGAAIATSATMLVWNFWAGYLVWRYHGIITVPFFAHKSKVPHEH